jgi:hypothetical protein
MAQLLPGRRSLWTTFSTENRVPGRLRRGAGLFVGYAVSVSNRDSESRLLCPFSGGLIARFEEMVSERPCGGCPAE